MGVMHSYLFASLEGEFFYLLQDLFVDTQPGMAGACIFTVFMAAVVTIFSKCVVRPICSLRNGQATALQELFSAFVFGVDLILYYLLMLLAMSFNEYILLSLGAGHGVGHFIALQVEKRRYRQRKKHQEEDSNDDKDIRHVEEARKCTPCDDDLSSSASELHASACHG